MVGVRGERGGGARAGGGVGVAAAGVGVVVQVYRAWDRAKCEIVAMEDVRGLPEGSELEVVMENPGWLRR